MVDCSQHFLQLPGEQVPLKSAFQIFTRHFKESLLCSRLESGIQNENEHEPAGGEIGKHASTSASPPQRTQRERERKRERERERETEGEGTGDGEGE